MADVIIPVYKPDKKFDRLLEQLFLQTVRPEQIILMNTIAGEEYTVEKIRERVERIARRVDRAGLSPVEVRIVGVRREDFDHGGTRHLAVSYVKSELFVCMTQDVIPADVFLLENLTEAFSDPSVAAAYARQLAGEEAEFTERYARVFNYPAQSVVKSKEDLERLGVKTYFCSNACAAYRKRVYEELGGFTRHTIFNEDMIFAAGAIQAGYRIAYQADARVYHTHHYTPKQQFQRNFDLAVSQADHPEVFQTVRSESEGLRYVKGALEYCIGQKNYLDAVEVVFDAAFRYAGYFLGKHYKALPKRMVAACTMNPAYWGKTELKQKPADQKKESAQGVEGGATAEDSLKTAEVLEELHRYEAEALKEFVSLCEEHGLRYYVIGGTLLGAVRHQGFIPWDDDVDVAMPRPDYDAFLKLAALELKEPYVIEFPEKDADFKSYFAKIRRTDITVYEELLENETHKRIGYLIDILPIDGTPDAPLAKKLYYAKVLFYRFLCGTANVTTGIRTSRPRAEQELLKLVRALKLYRFLDVRKVYKRMDVLFHKQNYETAKEIGTLMGAYKLREIVPREYFGDDYEAASEWQFEGFLVKGPERYKEYLRHMYGAYEIPPKEEARRPHYIPEIKKQEEML